MKSLTDLFQHHQFDYEFFDSEEFGTIAILYYAHLHVLGQSFGRAAQDILDEAGAHKLDDVLYIPNLPDEEILTLTMMGRPMQNIGFQSSPDVPNEVLALFRRNRRSWLVNYLTDFGDRSVRADRLEMLAYGVAPFVAYIGLKSLF